MPCDTAIIVPCRLESTRFPRKLLHPVKRKPLVLWVAERIAREAPALPLFFAVDDPLLAAPLDAAGFRTIPTSVKHQSGTDRIAEANATVRAARVINVQADEPLVTGAQIRALATLIAGPAAMATLATPFTRAADFANPNQVKVVLRADGRALYFSRAPIPFARDRGGSGNRESHGARESHNDRGDSAGGNSAGDCDDAWVATNPCYRHLGLYAYKAGLLERFATLPIGKLEQIEKLEQLRVLENGYEIAVGLTTDATIGVDTPEDAAKFEAALGA